MAEAIGELRRHILDLIRCGELKRGEELLEATDDMYYLLTSMDYPDGVSLGHRRLTDVLGRSSSEQGETSRRRSSKDR